MTPKPVVELFFIDVIFRQPLCFTNFIFYIFYSLKLVNQKSFQSMQSFFLNHVLNRTVLYAFIVSSETKVFN